MRIANRHNVYTYCLISLCSFFIFSKLSTPLGGYFRLGFNIFELLLIPVVLLYHKTILQFIRSKLFTNSICKCILTLSFLLFFFLYGCINASEYIITHLIFFRVYFLIAVIVFFFSTTNHFDLFVLFLVCLASQMGDFLYIITYGRYEAQVLNNTVSFSILISLCIFCRYKLVTVLGLLFLLLLAFRSTYRVVIFIYFITVITSFFISFLLKDKKNFFLMFLLFLLFIVFVIHFEVIIDFFIDFFDLTYESSQRITMRISSLLQGDLDKSNDNIRIVVVDIISQNLSSVFPLGLYRPALGQTGTYTDIPMILLIDSFGSVAALCVIFVIALRYFSVAYSFIMHKPKSLIPALVLSQFPCLVFLLYFNGTFIYWHYIAVFTSIILGLLFNPNIELIHSQRVNHFFIGDNHNPD